MKNKQNYFTLLLSLVIIILITVPTSCSDDDTKPDDAGEVVDQDGNTYTTISIGDQVWMAENLRTSSYNDGESIEKITDKEEWENNALEGVGAYSYYENSSSNGNKYGFLYNWHAVNSNKLCPIGWRVPTDEDWKILEGTVDSYYEANDPIWDDLGHRGTDVGFKLKSASGWEDHSADGNGNGSDDFYFKALPGGFRNHTGHFANIGVHAGWWTSTNVDASNSLNRSFLNSHEQSGRFERNINNGLSVRCIKD